MSQARNDSTNGRPDAEFATGDDGQYPPQSARQNRASQPEGQSDFIDGSGPIFSMYLEMAAEEDKRMAELTGFSSYQFILWSCIDDLDVDLRYSTEPTGYRTSYFANINLAIPEPNRSNPIQYLKFPPTVLPTSSLATSTRRYSASAPPPAPVTREIRRRTPHFRGEPLVLVSCSAPRLPRVGPHSSLPT